MLAKMKLQKKMMCETISTATKLDNLMVRKMGGKPPHFKFFNEHLRYRKQSRTFGEMALVASHDRKETRAKLKKEDELLCLLDMLIMALEMYTDSYISKLDKSF